MAERDVSFQFGADIADVKEGFDKIGESFKMLTERFEALAAVAAGGFAFKEFIDTAVKASMEAFNMSRMLGVTGEAAGTLSTALEDVGASTETYAGAFLHFNRQLRMNSDEMRSMGVDIAGLTSGQKTSNEVFVQALTVFGQYKPGIDQTQAAMRMFGRSVEDVYKIQRLANDVTEGTAKRLGQSRDVLNETLSPLQKYEANIETARLKNDELNLTISKEGVEATLKYKEAINDVEDVMKGVGKTIGEAVMPHFTALADQLAEFGPQIVEATGAAIQIMITLWDTLADTVSTVWGVIKDVFEALFGETLKVFGGDGLTAMEVFKNAVKVVQIAIVGFGVAVKEAFTVIGAALQWQISWLRTFAGVAIAAFHLDWDGIKRAWEEGANERVKILADSTQKMIDIAVEGREKIDAAALGDLSIKKGTPAGAPAGGTKTMPIGKDQSGQDPRLAAQLALQRAMQDASLKLTLEFLKEAGDQYDQAYKHGLVSTRDYYAAKLQIEQSANAAHFDTLRTELAQAADAEAKAQAKASEALKPQDRTKAEAEVLKFKTEQVKIQGQINVLLAQQADLERTNANEAKDAKQKAEDALTLITVTSAKTRAEFQVSTERAALQQMQALRQITAQASFNFERQMEDKSYNAQLANIEARRALVRGTQDEKIQQRAQLDAEAEAAEQQHQLRMKQIDDAAVQERMKFQLEAQQNIENAMGTALTDFMNGTKSLAGALKSFFGSVVQEINNMVAKSLIKNLFGSGTAGGGFLGNILGGITGNSSGGGIFGTLFSSAGGWDRVPADGVLTQLHKDEMVLPAGIADAVRQMASMSLPSSIGAMARMASIPGNAPQLQLAGMGPSVGQVTIHQNFPPATDTRTALQVSTAVGRGISQAMQRNG